MLRFLPLTLVKRDRRERKLEGLRAHRRAEAAAMQIDKFSLMLADGCRPCQLYCQLLLDYVSSLNSSFYLI
jgi:hypothetical protein